MTFTRTISGLKNYHKFVDSNILVYIEGRKIEQDNLEKSSDNATFDSIFYNSLFTLFFPNYKVKIKIIGSKNDALAYNDTIIKNDIDNSYVIIDRDYDEILQLSKSSNKLIYTHGYSWENDFWSKELCKDVIEYICLNKNIGNQVFHEKFNRSIHRLSLIYRANIICKYYGNEIFYISKKGGSHGFTYNVTNDFPVSKEERNRIFDKIPQDIKEKCDRVIMNKTKLHHRYLIQGHFYEYMCLQILSYALKQSSNNKSKNNDFQTIKNISFNLFRKDIRKYLNLETIEHYDSEFKRVIKQITP